MTDSFFSPSFQNWIKACVAVLVVCCLSAVARADDAKPVLISQPTSTRAVALEAVTHTHEPFSIRTTSPLYGPDRNTRIALFAMNLQFQQGESLSVMTAEAEDAAGRRYDLRVEDVRPVPGQEWMMQVVIRLDENLGDSGDVLVRVAYRGVASNRVRVGIGHVGGGPPDDAGASPTPARPYVISGRLLFESTVLGGITVNLGGSQTSTTTTDANGAYSFTVAPARSYTLTPSTPYFTFTPQSRIFQLLTGNQTDVDFLATRNAYQIGTRVTDEQGRGIDEVTVSLTSAQTAARSAQTTGGGNLLFTNVPAGYSYTVTPASNDVFTFASQTTTVLGSNLALSFSGERRRYSVGGQVTDGTSVMGGITVTISGGDNFSKSYITSADGSFLITDVPAGYDYTVTAAQTTYYIFSTKNLRALSGNQTVNLIWSPRPYAINGRITEGDKGISGTTVFLHNISYTVATYAVTGADGSFSFPEVPAKDDYWIMPLDTVLHSYTEQTVRDLSSNRTLQFTAALRSYTISGVILDNSQNPLAGSTVTLTGGSNTSVTTDFAGRYSFNGLPAGGNYRVTPSKTDHIFNPASLAFEFLSYDDMQANFVASRTYTVSGRVSEAGGRGVIGVRLTLSGPQTATTFTRADGTYTLFVTETGDYQLTPFMDQNYYAYAPASVSLDDFNSNRTADFEATFSTSVNPSYVLEFDGTPQTIDYGPYWRENTDLGHFYWEFWAMPGEDGHTRYLLSDGYGGAHALLFGFNGGVEPGRYNLYGNIFTGPFATAFTSEEGPAPNEWGHFAVGWDGRNINTYFNGVPVGRTPFTGPRRSPGAAWGSGTLFIGGSDHQNLIGRIAQVRGFEGSNPREASPESAFTPETVFQREGNLLSYFFRPAERVADLSKGFAAEGLHTGLLRGVINGAPSGCTGCPLPKFVQDPTAPNFSNPSNPGQINAPVESPHPVPAGARIFDSFSRPNSTYILGAKGGLSSTEGGALGARTWQTEADAEGRKAFGILNGRAVLLANQRSVAWVDAGAANLKVSVYRRENTQASGSNTGLSFRVVDASNYFFAYTRDNGANPRLLSVGYYLAGQRTLLAANVVMPDNWTLLTVTTLASGEIIVHADNMLIYSTSSGHLAGATGAGLYNHDAGMGLTNRWDNFTVSDAP